MYNKKSLFSMMGWMLQQGNSFIRKAQWTKKKYLATIKELIEEFTKHLIEYHNQREDGTRG